jgi:hypothetical protein
MTFFQKICLGIQLLRGVYIGKYPLPSWGRGISADVIWEKKFGKREKCEGKRRKDKGEIEINSVK